MHIGSKNIKHLYTLDNSTLTPVAEEKDLGIYFDQSLTFSIHCAKSVSKANSMIRLIKRTFSYMDKEIFLNLYKTMVQPHVEYGSFIWSPYYKKDIEILETVQRRATKLLPGFCNLSYPERLQECGTSHVGLLTY